MVIKIIVVGPMNVGKTSLIFRYCENVFMPSNKASVGFDFKVKTLVRDKTILRV